MDIPKRQEEAPKDEGPTKKQVRFRLPDAPNEDGSKTEEEMENATENSGNMEEGSYFGGRPSLKGYHIKDNIRGMTGYICIIRVLSSSFKKTLVFPPLGF